MLQFASRGLCVYAVLSFTFWTICGVMSFSEHRAPTFTIEPPTKVIFLNTSGESVHCAALGNPRPSISWVLADGTLVQDLPGLRLALANGTLLFLPFSAESYRQDIHASTYRCIASNLVGKISSRDIRIRAVVRQGYQVQVYDEFVIRGNTAVLRCQVPSIVRDYVIVTTWEREDGVTIVSNVANVHPKLSNSLPSTERDELWEELSSKLNNQTFGPKKSTFQWRRVWTDLKSEVKDKLAEINKNRQRGNRNEILNPCHKKVAILLAKASSQCAFIEKKGLTVSAIAERERDVGVKNEESSIFQNADVESSTSQPFVVTLNSIRNLPTASESRNLVKCEISATNDSSDPEAYVPPTQNVNCVEEPSIVEDAIPLTIPVFNKTKPKTRRKRHHKTEDVQLTSLVEAEKEKSNMLLAIADAISTSNQSKKDRLKIEEDRNRLIQERNVIESERNDIFRSLLEHLVSKEVI